MFGVGTLDRPWLVASDDEMAAIDDPDERRSHMRATFRMVYLADVLAVAADARAVSRSEVPSRERSTTKRRSSSSRSASASSNGTRKPTRTRAKSSTRTHGSTNGRTRTSRTSGRVKAGAR